MLGVPLTSGSGDQAVADFVDAGGVGSITHLVGDRLWRDLGATSMPSWMTITADGDTRLGAGSIPRSVLDGSWT